MAKKQILQIKNFSGGVNSYLDPRDLKENELQILDNAAVDEQGVIRVSGGIELKDNIDISSDALVEQSDGTFLDIESKIPNAGKGLFSHKTDYVYNLIDGSVGFNANLESDGSDTTSAWGTTNVDGDGTWAFEQVSTNTNQSGLGTIGATNHFAINYINYSAAGGDADNHDHGSLTFNNIPLLEDTMYTLRVKMVAERPWFYMGSNVPPRIRVYHPTNSLYLHPGAPGFTSTSDATHDAVCNDNISNFIDTPSQVGPGAGGADSLTWTSATHGNGDWTANGTAAILDREAIDANTPISSSANHKEFNSLFGTTDATGTMTNGWALELEGTHDSAFWNAGNSATSSPLSVSASTKYLFDAFYFTTHQCRVRIKKAGTSDIIYTSEILSNSSKWTHISGDVTAPTPITFETPSGVTSIEIEISVYEDDEKAFFAGFNIRKKTNELHMNSGGFQAGNFNSIAFPFMDYPNSWANEKNGTARSSSYISSSFWNPLYKRIRTYDLVFTTSSNLIDNKYSIEIDNGIWGGANQTDVNNIIINSVELLGQLGREYQEGRGNLILYNKFSDEVQGGARTSIGLHQYKPNEDVYEDISSFVGFPSLDVKSNFNFFKSGPSILFCDENFNDNNLYRFKFNQIKKTNELSVFDTKGIDIAYFDPNISNGLNETEYSALDNWLNIHSDNTEFLSMYSAMLRSYLLNSNTPFENDAAAMMWGPTNSFNQFSNDDDGTSDGNSTSPVLAIDYDPSAGGHYRFDYSYGVTEANVNIFECQTNNEYKYTKYITIPSYDIVSGTTSGQGTLIADSRVGKISVNLSHWMFWGAGPGASDGSETETPYMLDYIPQMDVYIDVVADAVVTRADDSPPNTDYSGTFNANPQDDGAANLVTTIASGKINPHEWKMGEPGVAGTLGYDIPVQRNDSDDSFGNISSDKTQYRLYMSQDTTPDGEPSLHLDFEFPYDFTYNHNGSATNLTVHATTGTNFQIRLVPRIDFDIDHATNGGDGSGTPIGVMSECWKVNKIDIWSWKTTTTQNISNVYPNLNSGEVVFTMAFETPLRGEADGWDSDWEPSLTYVDHDGIESALGGWNHGVISNTDVTKSPGISIFFNKTDEILSKAKFIKGYMKSTRNSNYNLQFIIDTQKKTMRSSTSSKENHALEEEHLINYYVPSHHLLIPNEIDSYESETGVLSKDALDYKNLKAVFKTAVIANNSLYAGNVKQNGVHYPDRMLKSPIGKAPLLPSSNFIDVAINDGDEITSLQFYKDRLLQFKKEKLFIISTSEDYEYLQDTIDNVGVASSSQVTMTPYGVAWINERGCYLYDGQNVNNLIDGKIAYKKWKDSEASWEINEKYGPSIHYLKKEEKLIVYGATDSMENISDNEGGLQWNQDNSGLTEFTYHYDKSYLRKMGYEYDFETKSWVNLTNYSESETQDDMIDVSLDGRIRVPFQTQTVTNFTYDEKGDSIFLMKPFNKFCRWDDNPKQTMGYLDLIGFDNSNTHRDFRIITKDYDFGAPSVRKKIYKVYVTFKSTDIESFKRRKINQNQDEYSSSNVGVFYAINGTNTWTEFSESKSTNYGTKGLISDDSETTTTLAEATSGGNTVVVSSASNIKVGYVLKINEERMLVVSVSGTTIGVDRNYTATLDESALFSHNSGDTVYISTGDWIVAELKPSSSINNIDSFKLKFETKKVSGASNDNNGVPPGFMINDISVIYRTKNVK